MTGTPEYQSWASMKTRCLNPKIKHAKNYSGRGVKVCDRWANSFSEFYKDMGPRPKGKTLDRIDNDGNYEPGNCRWATPRQQRENTRPKSNMTGYTGVSLKNSKYMAKRVIQGKEIYLGVFNTAEEAHRAYLACPFGGN